MTGVLCFALGVAVGAVVAVVVACVVVGARADERAAPMRPVPPLTEPAPVPVAPLPPPNVGAVLAAMEREQILRALLAGEPYDGPLAWREIDAV